MGHTNIGVSNRMKLAVIHRKPETINISHNWKKMSAGYTKMVPVQVQQKIVEDEDVLLADYLTTEGDKISSKQLSNLNSARHKLSNTQIKDKLLRNKYLSSQKESSHNEQETNNQLNQLNNRYNLNSNKKPTKMSVNLYPQKPYNSVSITQLDKIGHSALIQVGMGSNKEAGFQIHFKEKIGINSSNFVIKEKFQPYFRRRRPSQTKNIAAVSQDSQYTISAFDRLQGLAQNPVEKDAEKIQIIEIEQPLHKMHIIQKQVYFAQSFKGRRPYNEDRYFCQTKSSINIRQRLQVLHNRSNGSPIKCESKQQSLGGTKQLNSKYWLFGVFDGHGGSKCSEFLKENFHSFLSHNKNLFIDSQLAIRETFSKAQEKFLSICDKGANLQTSGSCAVVCLIRNNKIYIGNVGDSRALLLGASSFKQVTKDHKPDDKQQKSRIIRFGGKLYKDGSVLGAIGKQNIRVFNQTRIMPGSLNVSRTLGDIEVKMKKYGGLPGIVIAEPEIFVQSLDQQYDHILLASDGLFEGMANSQIHNSYKKMIGQFIASKKDTDDTFAKTYVKQIIRQSGQKSSDNITVIFVKLPKRRDQC